MIWFYLLLSASLCCASNPGLDGEPNGDEPGPTPGPTLPEPIYGMLEIGAVPLAEGVSRGQRVGREGRLDARQFVCEDLGYILACPITESKPCCPISHPTCCHDPSDTCCAVGSFCCGTSGCCENGTTCCNGRCCRAGYVCRSGSCTRSVDPSQSRESVNSVQSRSSRSVLSTQSRASVASVQSQESVYSVQSRASRSSRSVLSTRSRASIASIQSQQSVQSEQYTSQQSRASISSRSVISTASIASQASLSSLSRQSEGSTTDTTALLPSNPDNLPDNPVNTDPVIISTPKENGPIIGGAVGGVLGAIAIAGIVTAFIIRKKRRKPDTTSSATFTSNQPAGNVPYSSTAGTAPTTTAGFYGKPGVTIPAMVYNTNEASPPGYAAYDSTAVSQPTQTGSPSNATYGSSSFNVVHNGRPLSGDSSAGVTMWVQRPDSGVQPPNSAGNYAAVGSSANDTHPSTSYYPSGSATRYASIPANVTTPPPDSPTSAGSAYRAPTVPDAKTPPPAFTSPEHGTVYPTMPKNKATA